jgi:two-component system sensor histidine kinase YesM
MSLNKKMLLAFLAFVIAPMFVLGTVAYFMSQQLIVNKFGDQTEITLRAIGRNISDVFKEANYFSDFWMVKESIQSLYRKLDQVPPNGPELSSYELNEMDTALRSTLLTYSPIQSVVLFNRDGRSISAGRMTNGSISYQAMKESGSFAQVIKSNGAPVWIGPKEDANFPGAPRDFYQVRIVKDFWTLDDRGYLLLLYRFADWNPIFHFYNSGEDRSRRYLLIDKQGLVLFDNRQELEGQRLPGELMAKVGTDRRNGSFKSRFQGEDSLISTYRLEMEELGARGWSLVSITSWNYVTGEITMMMDWMTGITLLCLLCALLFNFAFVRRTVRFLLRVAAAMKKVEIGDLTTRVKVSGKDETMVLAKGFNSLVGRIEDLLDEVKRQQDRKNRAELMLLQAQIKPHFLFNTLESINVLAIQNQGKKVSQMVHRLGNLLRLSIDSREVVPVRSELEHLKSYLDIQKFRFEDTFTYEIDVPEELLDCTMPKLTLQPLVENSIQHGFEGLGRMGAVTVYGADEGKRFAIYVADNGVGIPPEKLACFRYHAAEEEDVRRSGDEAARKGLGVNNVADRIRIRYGAPYGLYVCGAPGAGTTVKVLIPKVGGDSP